MKIREFEILKDLKEQGFMPDIDSYEKSIAKQKKGMVKDILSFGLSIYLDLRIQSLYLPLAKAIILVEKIK